MKRFVRRLRGEEGGLTLIELIASISIMSMALLAIYGVIQFGFNTYHKVTIENSLRDEGDLIMSTVISQLYDKGATSVSQSSYGIDLTAIDDGTYSIRLTDERLEIVNTKTSAVQPVETDSKIDQARSGITLVCTPASPICGSGRIDIKLVLYQMYGGRRQELELDSRFGF